jgi:hypothetical protein
MKTQFKLLCLAASLSATGAIAATTTDTLTEGDVLFGVYASSGVGATQNLIVNLGGFQQFDNRDNQTTQLSANILADISSTFGSSWNSRTDLTWVVAGATLGQSVDGLTRNTIFATSPRFDASDAPVSITGGSSGTQASIANAIASVGNTYNSATTIGSGTVTAVVDGADVDSLNSRLTLTSSAMFGPYNVNDTTGSNVSDFYALVPTSGGVAPTGNASTYSRGTNYLGYFTLDSSGLSFTSAIPETSSFAFVGGLAVLGSALLRRRRNRVA